MTDEKRTRAKFRKTILYLAPSDSPEVKKELQDQFYRNTLDKAQEIIEDSDSFILIGHQIPLGGGPEGIRIMCHRALTETPDQDHEDILKVMRKAIEIIEKDYIGPTTPKET